MAEQVTTPREINRAIRKQLISTRLIRIGGLNGQAAVASGLGEGVRLTVKGRAGDFFASFNGGAVITLTGSAGRWLADSQVDGAVVVEGDVGDGAGINLQGGAVVVQGSVGKRAAQFARGGAVLVAGPADGQAGCGMFGGDLVLCGGCRGTVGDWMQGGRIYVAGEARLGPNAVSKPMTAKDRERVDAYLQHYGLEPKGGFMKVLPASRSPFPPQPPEAAPEAPPIPFSKVGVAPARIPKLIPLDPYRTEVGTQVMVGEGRVDRPITLSRPIFFDLPPYPALAPGLYRAMAVASVVSGIPLVMGPYLPPGDVVMEIVERAGETRTPLFLDWGELRSDLAPSLLKAASGIILPLQRGVGGGSGGVLRGHDGGSFAVPPAPPEIGDPKDLSAVIGMLREITQWEKPITVRVAASQPFETVKHVIESGADAVLIDQARNAPWLDTRATPVPLETAFLSTIRAFRDTGARKKGVVLLASGAWFDGDAAFKALALGADLVGMCEGFVCIALGRACPKGPQVLTAEDLGAISCPEGVVDRFTRFADELMVRVRRLCAVTGHRDITSLNPNDLIALDYDTATLTGLKLLGFEKRLPMWEH